MMEVGLSSLSSTDRKVYTIIIVNLKPIIVFERQFWVKFGKYKIIKKTINMTTLSVVMLFSLHL